MRFPLALTVKIARHIIKHKMRRTPKFALVLQLEPLHTCNLTCTGCGRIREYKSTISEMISVEQCVAAAEELFGPGSAQALKVAEAFDTVEIMAAPSTPDPSPVPVVQGPDSTVFVYFDWFVLDYALGRRETPPWADRLFVLSYLGAHARTKLSFKYHGFQQVQPQS